MEEKFEEYYSILEEQENRVLRSDELAKLNAVNQKLRDMVMAQHSEQQVKKLQVELVELRRVNKELQHDKRQLNVQLAASQAQIAALLSRIERIEAEAADLRPVNEQLSKQVEGLQVDRFSEVEELVYLRWVNACLRYELKNLDGSVADVNALKLNKDLSPNSQEKVKNLMVDYTGTELFSRSSSRHFDSDHESSTTSSILTTAATTSSSSDSGELSSDDMSRPRKVNLMKKIKGTWGRSRSCSETSSTGSSRKQLEMHTHNSQLQVLSESSGRDSSDIAESFHIMSRSVKYGELADRYPSFKDRHKLDIYRSQTESGEAHASSQASEAASAPKPAKAPPTTSPPPPPPPPLQTTFAAGMKTAGKFRRAPQVIELYHSMMKRGNHSKNDARVPGNSCNIADARNNMIGEIENRSSHLLAIKADIQNHGELVESLAAEIRAAVFTAMDDVVVFVKGLDEQLSILVDERAVLKHFNWPESKVDALRESASEYQKLNKLERQVAAPEDDSGAQRDEFFKKIQSLLERVEQSIHGFLRTRDSAVCRYKENKIPTQWMLDTGFIAKMKQSSVKLAERFIKRVVSELNKAETELMREFLVLQGVRFAFRVHQFAGGFDDGSMRAFELLRGHARNASRPSS